MARTGIRCDRTASNRAVRDGALPSAALGALGVAVKSSTVDQLRVALAQASDLVAGVSAEQWTAATPCEGWDVRALVSHLVAGNRLFAAALRGDQPAQVSVDDDLVAVFNDSASELLAAFGGAGALQRVVDVPFGTVPGEVALHLRLTEILVHGWDLARATGQRQAFDEAVAVQELEFTLSALGAIPADRQPFGPAQQPPPDASAVERLAALLGREIVRTE